MRVAVLEFSPFHISSDPDGKIIDVSRAQVLYISGLRIVLQENLLWHFYVIIG